MTAKRADMAIEVMEHMLDTDNNKPSASDITDCLEVLKAVVNLTKLHGNEGGDRVRIQISEAKCELEDEAMDDKVSAQT